MMNPMHFNKFIDAKLDKIASAGNFFGRFIGRFGRTTTKVIIAVGILFVFGFGIFLWAFGQGMKKKDT